MPFSVGGLVTGPITRALLVLNPFRYGIEQTGGDGFFKPSFLFDLAISESFNQEAEVTEYAIQNGSDITDHIHFNLGEGNFTGKVSNHSIYAPPILDPTGLIQSDRFKTALDELERIYRAGELVTVYSVMRKYENVLIKSLDYERDSESGQAQEFNISFKETRIISPAEGILRSSVDVPMTTPDNRQGAPKLNLGSI
jgi:hypothetical protein